MGKKEHKSETFSFRPFDKLKKKIASQHAVLVHSPLHAKKEKPASEEYLFTSAMSDVEVIEEFRELSVAHKKVTLKPGRKDPDREALTVLDEIAHGQRPIDLSGTQEYVEWTDPHYRDDLTRKLHGGHFSVQNYLDLHGCTLHDAEEELHGFLADAFKQGLRCVKIIHGRGLRSSKGPLLKDAVVKWLSGRYRKHIIAYVTARQCDGGLGALYVLLRKK